MKILLLALFWATFGGILYTYFAFPLLLKLATLFIRTDHKPIGEETGIDDLPTVAMVVAAFNEGAVIADKLDNTWQIDYPSDRLELVIGSDGSADETDDILRACADERLKPFLFAERRGKISVLNNLLSNVKADIVVMSDANTMYAPDAVRRLVRHFQDPNVGCVSGRLRIEQDGGVTGEGLYWRYENWIKENESKLGFLMGCNGGIFALRRNLYSPLPASTIVEDFVLTLRVLEQGYRVEHDLDASATEPACVSARAEMVRKIRIGAGNWQALTLTAGLLHPRHGLRSFAFWGHKVLRWTVPILMIVNLGANVALVGTPFYAAVLALQLFGLAVSLTALNRRMEQRMPRFLRPISYYYLMNFSLLCGFIRFITKTQRVTWDRGPMGPPSGPTALLEDFDGLSTNKKKKSLEPSGTH